MGAIAPIPPRCKCQQGRGRAGLLLGVALAFQGGSSFAEGSEVLTPEGKVAIETLREGDTVIARNEETGVSGVFPVTALMSRQATDTMWITLEDAQGQMTRMGVTSEHPLFVIDEGWLDASQVAPGDQIRNSNLQALTVLSIDVDTRPQIVHNLEIANAHTYFAGELESWRLGGIIQRKASGILSKVNLRVK